MSAPPENPRPLIVLLAINKAEFYDECFADLNDLLKRHAEIKQATSLGEARAYFDRDPKPAAILSADESLTVSAGSSLVEEAARYVRAGGTLVFMGLFSGFSRPPNMRVLFAKFDLPWSAGDYHRTTCALNPAVTLLDTRGMASSYSQKALHLAGVPRSDAVYLPSDDSRIESAVFSPLPVDDRTQTPAAFASLGAGRIGYVGDVNNERETMTVVLRMCGLVL